MLKEFKLDNLPDKLYIIEYLDNDWILRIWFIYRWHLNADGTIDSVEVLDGSRYERKMFKSYELDDSMFFHIERAMAQLDYLKEHTNGRSN